MKILLLAIGKTTEKYLSDGIEEYCKRLIRYAPFEFIIIPDIKFSKSEPIEIIKNKEGKTMLERIKPGDRLILLDERGIKQSSKTFSQFLSREFNQTAQRLVFAIGGPYGFSEAVYNRAAASVSLSEMTFSHQMVRLIFTEQLYRAFTIIKGEPYHHE